MTEGEVVEQLVEFTTVLITATGVFFTILSVYLAGLNYVLHNETWFTRTVAFIFVTITLGMLVATMIGAETTHAGLIARLQELDAAGELSAAGRAVLANNTMGFDYGPGMLTVDEAVVYLVWGALVLVYVALVYLTFFYRWRPDSLPPAAR